MRFNETEKCINMADCMYGPRENAILTLLIILLSENEY